MRRTDEAVRRKTSHAIAEAAPVGVEGVDAAGRRRPDREPQAGRRSAKNFVVIMKDGKIYKDVLSKRKD